MTRRIVVWCLAGSLLLGCGDDTQNTGGDGGQEAGRDAAVPSGEAGLLDGAPGGDGEVDAGPAPTADCEPLPPPSGTVVRVEPSQADELREIVAQAEPGTTILLADGYYDMSGGDTRHRLRFLTEGVTLRSESGNPEAVILDGGYGTDELVSIAASNVTIAEITLQRAYNHPIHVTGGAEGHITGVRLYRVRVIDPGQQGIKVNATAEGHYADNGRIECSHVELTDDGRPHIRDNCYTGGIDVHKARGWVVRRNTIVGFWCPSGLSEHGIHFWRQCRDTLVEDNVIVNCARGIGFGMASQPDANPRVYPDDPYPDAGYLDHIDGIIRNNFIFASINGFDSGISVWQARKVRIYHNTVASTVEPFSSIEWRFEATEVVLKNNLVTHVLMARNGAIADSAGNLEHADLSFFVDPEAGDLHLRPQAAAAAIDHGVDLDPGECDEDIDGEPRQGPRDIGADEVTGR